MNRFISFAGNIGCGKTSAAELLATTFDLPIYYEPVFQNRFLSDYYGDMQRWAFTLQMEFLLKRSQDQVDLQNRATNSCVQDRTLIEDPEVFARYLHQLGYMTNDELDLYLEFFHKTVQELKMPDVIVLLYTDDVGLILERIKKRGRPEERSITHEFIAGLNYYYARFESLVGDRYASKVVRIDISEHDLKTPDGATHMFELLELPPNI